MAFSNLWSSERLSFSLSIIAVISAAITTYHQYSHSTEVRCYRTNFNVTSIPGFLPDGSFQDSISGSLTFMNSGSTPVSIISSQVILHADTAQVLQAINENGYITLSPQSSSYHSVLRPIHSDYYLDTKSLSSFRFATNIDSTALKELLNEAIPAAWDSTMVSVNFYLWLLMADPFGDLSMDVVRLASYAYSNETNRPRFGYAPSFDFSTRRMPTFRNLDFWTDLSEEKLNQVQPPPSSSAK